MNRFEFYYKHSLLAFFIQRAQAKWFPPAKLDVEGVTLQLDCLPAQMRYVILSGAYECNEMTILPSFIQESDQVLEIGSAIGFLGLYCQKVLKVKRLVGVEPNPVTLEYLRRNYALNNIKPNIIEAAIAAKDGPVTFHTTDMFWTDSLATQSNNPSPKHITVEGLSFTSILRRAGPGFNTLIIDVEGAEEYIPFDSIPSEVNKILIEIHPEVTGGRKAFGILEILIRSGFTIHAFQNNCCGLIRSGHTTTS
jgi:FkbM family methyltransferase